MYPHTHATRCTHTRTPHCVPTHARHMVYPHTHATRCTHTHTPHGHGYPYVATDCRGVLLFFDVSCSLVHALPRHLSNVRNSILKIKMPIHPSQQIREFRETYVESKWRKVQKHRNSNKVTHVNPMMFSCVYSRIPEDDFMRARKFVLLEPNFARIFGNFLCRWSHPQLMQIQNRNAYQPI